jgi:glycosyltransferase involved in cell wall biosynthesis
MKVLFAIKALDVPGGGAERVLTIVASGLAARGHDVTVMTFDAPGGKSFYPMDGSVRRIGLGIGPTTRRTGLNSFLRRLPALRRTIRDERPAVVVGFMHSMIVPLALAMIGTGVPFVASEHNVPERYAKRRLEFVLFQLACLTSDRVTVLSEPVRSLFPAWLRRRMTPMPNPVVVHEGCTPDPVAPDRETKTILSVGRLEPQKDHTTLIDAFASIADRFPDWRVRIVGDGTLRPDLEAAVARHGLDSRVSLPGSTERVDLEYSRAQLVAVPSLFESFGMVTAEAMAVGLPVVGFSDCPGTNELIHHDENGWLVTPGGRGDRARAYAEGLSALLEDAGLRRRLGEAARKSMERLDSQRVVLDWERLLLDVGGEAS